jgi:hypothetical protein
MNKSIRNPRILIICAVCTITYLGLLWSCSEETYNPGIQAPVIKSIDPPAAFPGQEVEIAGRNFSSAVTGNTVSFNGTDATIISTTTLAIKVLVPDGAVSGDVKVTTNNLTSEGFTFTVTEPVIPAITSLDPATAKVGSEIVISGINFSTTAGENKVSFNGVEATVTEATATTLTVIVPAGTTSGDVTVTVDGESNGLYFTLIESMTVSVQIPPNSSDDAEEGALNGAVALESSDLELGEYDTWAAIDDVPQGVQTIGLRFTGVTIPQGATILSASIQFTCDVGGSDPAEMTIYGENTADALTYTEELYSISGRPRTTAKAVWQIPEWIARGDAGAAQRTVDLAALVQEIVNRVDWASGNSMAFILEPSGDTLNETSSDGGREAEASEGHADGTQAAVLTVVYDE